MTGDKKFSEALPISCPPTNAIDKEIGPLFRLVSMPKPSENCFASHAKLKRQKPIGKQIDDCRWASCSMFTKMTAINDLLKLKSVRKRYSHVATVNLPKGAGKHVANDDHVDFWRYGEFDICSAVKSVESF